MPIFFLRKIIGRGDRRRATATQHATQLHRGNAGPFPLQEDARVEVKLPKRLSKGGYDNQASLHGRNAGA